jgi:hypothetical protein
VKQLSAHQALQPIERCFARLLHRTDPFDELRVYIGARTRTSHRSKPVGSGCPSRPVTRTGAAGMRFGFGTEPPMRGRPARRAPPSRHCRTGCRWSTVSCWTIIDLERIVGPATSVPILIFTKAHPRSLLSIARSKRARSLVLPSRSRKKRIDQICLTLSARLAPTCLPAFQADLAAAAGSYREIPITILL